MNMTRRTWLGSAAAGIFSTVVCAHSRSNSLPNIIGNTWTPDRDVSGKVREENWRNLPLNAWLLVGKSVLNDVIETPHLRTVGLYDSAPSIMTAWSGAAYDPVRQRFYITGGGHTDSDECETGIYCFDIPSCTFSRIQNRADPSLRYAWDQQKNVFTSLSIGSSVSCPILPDGGAFDGAGSYGRPGAFHTRYALQYLPPLFMGNISGGIWLGQCVYNLDSHRYDTPYWWNTKAGHVYSKGVGSQASHLFDGNSIYAFHDRNYVSQFNLTEKQATDWSDVIGKDSDQKCYVRKYSHSITLDVGDGSAHCIASEIRHYVSLSSNGHVRIRYGQAIDSGNTNWSAYTDNIAMTSSDGSHLELASSNFVVNKYASLSLCGVSYDSAADCLWIQPNNVGDLLYRIDGISTGNTWATTKIAGTGALKRMTNGTYGRMRLATMAGKKVLVRLNSIHDPVQVMRIS